MAHAASRALPLCLLALVASCGRPERPSTPPSAVRQRAPAGPVQAAPISPSAYVAAASSIDLFVIGSSELVLQRSGNSRVREFATMMVESHKGTSAQLSLAGRRLNLLPSATLSPEHRAMLNELQQAANFEATYQRQQRAVHAEALTLHTGYAARGTSSHASPRRGGLRSHSRTASSPAQLPLGATSESLGGHRLRDW